MLKEEMKKREERWHKTDEELGAKYKKLLEEVEKAKEERENLEEMRKKDAQLRDSIENSFKEEIEKLRAEVERETKETQKASYTAECVFSHLNTCWC